MAEHSVEKDAPLSADARLDYRIEDAERAAEPCLDCAVGEPHVCRNIPPDSHETRGADSCSCGAPDTASLTPGEVVVHRYDGRPCYIGDAS